MVKLMAADTPADQASGTMQLGQGVALQNVVAPPLISADIASKYGELLLNSRWGEERAREQIPLRVEDKGDRWRVIGITHNEQSAGRFCLLVRKADGLILDISVYEGPGGLPE